MNLTSMHARSRMQGVELSAETRVELLTERQRRGLTRAAVARQIGCHTEHVGQLERGTHSPRWDVLHRWGQVLGFPINVTIERA